MKLSALLDILRQVAPESLAESWDQVGLHVGESTRNIRRALLCIDLTEAVLDEAIQRKAELIVAYHPPIFQPLARLTDATPKQQLILRAAQKRIAIYSSHTALDAVHGGIADWLCEGLGQGSATTIAPVAPSSPGYKLAVYVPSDHVEQVRDAMFAAGAGVIGRYSHCSFSHPGQGTFKGSHDTHPFIGVPGQMETVAEICLEMACRPDRLSQAIVALRQSHPYEEPAYDVCNIEPVSAPFPPGAGRIWTLDRSITAATLTRRIKAHLKVKHLEVANAGKPIRCIAVCPGAGASLLMPVEDVDAYLTGEMRHHDILESRSRQISVFLAGHTQTERPYLPRYRQLLIDAGHQALDWIVSDADVAPTASR